METRIIKIESSAIDPGKISEAAEAIKRGGLVAFPTETVYGLGADALNEQAVADIFTAKGRPPDNPLIVHISVLDEIYRVAAEVPAIVKELSSRFWPGPLTLVVKKSALVPHIVTAGLDTVAVRMPSHPIALALIKACGRPIAAPSANLSGKPSPTDAEHVVQDLYGKVDIIIDAGSASVGLESTVFDITVSPPVILRPGGITGEQLQAFLGSQVKLQVEEYTADKGIPRSPGMKYKHYSPAADMLVVEGDPGSMSLKIARLAADHVSRGHKTAIIATDENVWRYRTPGGPACDIFGMGRQSAPETIAKGFYGLLRNLDSLGYEVIIAEAVNKDGIGAAIMNRMYRAAGNHIIKV